MLTGLEDYNQDATGPDASSGPHLETPSRLMGSSPRMLANLQSSPDLFQLGTIDPSASPFLPQQKLFWDDHFDQPASDLGLSGTSNVDLFGSNGLDAIHNNHGAAAGNGTMHDPAIPQLPTIEGTVDLPEFNNTSGFGITTTSAAPTDAAFFPAPFSTSPRLPQLEQRIRPCS